jgi:hypothetical protein
LPLIVDLALAARDIDDARARVRRRDARRARPTGLSAGLLIQVKRRQRAGLR